MVRVICVHHFTRQDVTSLDDSGECHGSCAGLGDWLLVAGDHRVNIRDLGNGGAPAGGFPTVDMVQQILYCEAGNFVVTLETKPARQGFSDHTYVRVYVNWEKQALARASNSSFTSSGTSDDLYHHQDSTSSTQSGHANNKLNDMNKVQQNVHDNSGGGSKNGSLLNHSMDGRLDFDDAPPMRARIAGRVTPSGQSASSEVLEMIEIPLKKPASFVNLCQSSGNIIVVSGMSLSIFKFDKKVLDTPRLEYIDFDEILEIDVGFYVREAALMEDIVGCVSDREAHVFQIVTVQAYQSGMHKVNQGTSHKTYSVLKDTGTWTSNNAENGPDNTSYGANNGCHSSQSRSNSRSSSRSKSRGRSMSRSPSRFPGPPIDERLRTTKNRNNKEEMASCPRDVVLADSYMDLSTAEWSNMIPYGAPPVNGALQQQLPGGHKLLLLPSILQPTTTATDAAGACSSSSNNRNSSSSQGTESSDAEHIGPIRSNHVSPVRIKLLSGSGERIITGVFHAVTLVHRRVDLPYPPPSCTPHNSNPPEYHHGGGVSVGSNQWHQGVAPSLNTHVPFSNLKLRSLSKPQPRGVINSSRSAHPLLASSPRGGASPRLPGTRDIPQYPHGCLEVFFSSPMTGYLYHVTLQDNPYASSVQLGCQFSYTSAAASVVLEQHSLLHALTLTGLETYTLPPHPCVLDAALPKGVKLKVSGLWSTKDSTASNGIGAGLGGCLVGLRPFLNVHSLALTRSCLALIATPEDTPKSINSNDSEDTMYCLHRPSPSSLYKEMLRVGSTHYSTAPSTYLHLLLEAMLVLFSERYWALLTQKQHQMLLDTTNVNLDKDGKILLNKDGTVSRDTNVLLDKDGNVLDGNSVLRRFQNLYSGEDFLVSSSGSRPTNSSGSETARSAGGVLENYGRDGKAMEGLGIEECMKLKMAGKKLEEMESDLGLLERSSPRDWEGKSRSMSYIEDKIHETNTPSLSASKSFAKQEDGKKKKGTKERNKSSERKRRGERRSVDRSSLEPVPGDDCEDVWLLIVEAAMLLADYYALNGGEMEWQWSIVDLYLGFSINPATLVSRLTALRDRQTTSDPDTTTTATADTSAASAGGAATATSSGPTSATAVGCRVGGLPSRGSGATTGTVVGTTTTSGANARLATSGSGPTTGTAATSGAGGRLDTSGSGPTTGTVAGTATTTSGAVRRAATGGVSSSSAAAAASRVEAATVHALCNMLTDPRCPELTTSQANTVLECLEKLAPERVSQVLLRSHCLPDFRKDKVLSVLKKQLSTAPQPRPTDVLALASIIVDRGSSEQVSTVLGLLRPHQLLAILQQHHSLLIQPANDASTAHDTAAFVNTASGNHGGDSSCYSSISSTSTSNRVASLSSQPQSAVTTPRTNSCTTITTNCVVVLTPLALVLLDHKWDIFCEVFMSLIGDSVSHDETLTMNTTKTNASACGMSSQCPLDSRFGPGVLVGGGPLTLDSFVQALMEARPIVTCGPECNVNSLRLRDFLEAYFMEYAYVIAQNCENESSSDVVENDRPYERSISVLVSLYLASLLGAFTAQSREEAVKEEQRQCMEEVYGPRPTFLNLLPPLGGSSQTSTSPDVTPTPGDTTPNQARSSKNSTKREHTSGDNSSNDSFDNSNQNQVLASKNGSSSENASSKEAPTCKDGFSTAGDDTSCKKSSDGGGREEGGVPRNTAMSTATGGGNGKKPCTDLLILQSLLCSSLPSPRDREHVSRFVGTNRHMMAADSILCSCLSTAHQAPQLRHLLLTRHPHAYLQYAKDTCSSPAEWRCVVADVSAVQHLGKPYTTILSQLLLELCSTLPFDEFLTVLPTKTPEGSSGAAPQVTPSAGPVAAAASRATAAAAAAESSAATASKATTSAAAGPSSSASELYSDLIRQSHSSALAQHLVSYIHSYADAALPSL